MAVNQGILRKYQSRLRSIPPPGGNGCHNDIMGIANLGVLAGLSAERIFLDIRDHIPSGQRRVLDGEIWDAINKALADHGRGFHKSFAPKPKPIVKNGNTTLAKIIEQGVISDEADLNACSPIRIDWPPEEDHFHFLQILFPDKDDRLFIGDRNKPGVGGKTIKTVEEHAAYFEKGGKTEPFIIINPLTGAPALKKTGDGETYRGDGCVAKYSHFMVEFDGLSRADQIRFWSAIKLPICVLIDSGGKSIHAWIDVSKLFTVETPEQWQSEIKGRYYDRILTPLGVDAACSNPARLSRLPGHYRSEKQAWQRLLWLSPEGRTVIS